MPPQRSYNSVYADVPAHPLPTHLSMSPGQQILDIRIGDQQSPDPGLHALLTGTAFAPLEDLGWLRITGGDRTRWLNGMVTNSIESLRPGDGCYNFILSAQGRIQGDATAFALPDSLLLETGRSRIPALVTLLDRFIIMDDVELSPLSQSQSQPDRHGLLLAGPHAPTLLSSLGLPSTSAPPIHLASHLWQGAPVDLVYAHSPLIPRFELWAEPAIIALLSSALLEAGAIQASASSLEALRLLEGTPLFGIDIRDRELPQETTPAGTPSRALHFSKGCYLGQEIVERIRSRGNVRRTFSGFLLSGDLPLAGTPLFSEASPDKPLDGPQAKPVGELTTVARLLLPHGPAQLALGYIRREILDRGAKISYEGGTAVPATLPFPIAFSPETPAGLPASH